ncbi:MAG: hypothetical protein EB127_10205 [Alphaproteobacteria bacterium]|nr:hypothetical protein [Alphaproteobacteria bacterium]
MKLEVTAINTKENGDVELEIDLDEEYIAHLKKTLGMKRWSNKKFQQFIINALSRSIKNYKE